MWLHYIDPVLALKNLLKNTLFHDDLCKWYELRTNKHGNRVF